MDGLHSMTIDTLAQQLHDIMFDDSLSESEKYDRVDSAVCSATELTAKQRQTAYCQGCGWTEELRKLIEEHDIEVPYTPEEQAMIDSYYTHYSAYYPRPYRVWHSYRGE